MFKWNKIFEVILYADHLSPFYLSSVSFISMKQILAILPTQYVAKRHQMSVMGGDFRFTIS